MTFLDAVSSSDREILIRLFRPLRFPKGSRILKAGDAGDGCFLIDSGEVRLELENNETDSESVLGHLTAGSFLGELSLLDGQPRSATAYADTDVATRWLSKEDFDRICSEKPSVGVAVVRAIAADVASKIRVANDRLATFMFADEIDAETDAMVERARAAQALFAGWEEARVDALLQDIATTVAARAEELARATVAETRKGVVEDKTAKNRFASLTVYEALAGKPAAGLLAEEERLGVRHFACPVGVIFAMIPVTNPVATFVFKTLIGLKSRNALILSCHRDAVGVGTQIGEIIRDVIRRHGAPVDLIQWIRNRASRRTTAMFMKHPGVSLILATGGPSMVRAAYSSGTPAIGVGSGNAPVLVAKDADLEAAARQIVSSKSFDNGMICASENNLIVEECIRDAFIAQLVAAGAGVVSESEKSRLGAVMFDEHGELSRDAVGQSAALLCHKAAISRFDNPRLLVVPLGPDEVGSPFAREKLSPVVSLFAVPSFAEGIKLCQQVLHSQGRGHTAAVHTSSRELADQFAQSVDASRIVVNGPSTQGAIGLGTGLLPSLTLGCGTFGGNSTTDNVSFKHLLNIKRQARVLAPAPATGPGH